MKITSENRSEHEILGSGGGGVVKILACRAQGPGFDSRSRHFDFRDWVSPASKLQCDGKIVKATLNPQNNPTKHETLTYHRIVLTMAYIHVKFERFINDINSSPTMDLSATVTAKLNY